MPKPKLTQPRPRTLSDPLAAALLPPPNESPEERNLRIQRENDAKRISESIDEQLQQERIERKKARPEVNVLLLGQSESGKSTTLKRESPPPSIASPVVGFCPGCPVTYRLCCFVWVSLRQTPFGSPAVSLPLLYLCTARLTGFPEKHCSPSLAS